MPLRKRTVPVDIHSGQSLWLSLEEVAQVEVSSEHHEWPIDGALMPNSTRGWRAAETGAQKLRIRFDTPQALSLIHLVFDESEFERVQEFTLRWSRNEGRTFEPLIRQQFSFSPAGATRETENYSITLAGVTDLELGVVPDLSGRPVVATLTTLRLR